MYMYMCVSACPHQAENAALTREKMKLESQLTEERAKVKQLESTLAKRDAEV